MMQTNFSPDQLKDPRVARSEQIVRKCVHCGFCTATCPTYVLLGDELDSPRGRIYLIKEMLEQGKAATSEVVKHVDRCLSCLSCMTTCPSGVNYMHLIDHARAHIERTYQRSWHDRLLRAALAAVLPYPGRFRVALGLARLGRPLRPLLAQLPKVGPRLNAMLRLAAVAVAASPSAGQVRVFPAQGERKGRVALLTGCAQPVLKPSINEATIRLLNRHGIEVVLPAGEGCCGALAHHMGRDGQSLAFARTNVDAWMSEVVDGLDAILTTASGCGTTIKNYGFMLRTDPAYAEPAAQVSALAKDVSEYLGTLNLVPARETAQRVAYHSACSLQHGQQIREEPKALLKRAGFVVKDIPEGHICCGSAGTYNILQPEIAGRLRDRKVANVLSTKPDIIATGNTGCITQIAQGLADASARVPIVHTVELLDWATGGPMPHELRVP
jgi:glycolate oxidase iron-sulfur subunit